ncbi:MAG: response regulator transcription factor [Bacteroidales bacterium]|nr:response regulator transcription factor [Bacteroidales bacterium]MCF8345267.1 response regulator transcription factor [Bacteroidales bacterium]MCF8375677.1 response regulator transcription factor [Bacteroidales bacterium]MCF8401475.1 response regulator transcription factor [Bacteroidales bacterium]
MAEKNINIIIVDDHEIFRNGLKMVLNRLKYVNILAEASNGKEFLELLPNHHPDIVLMDIEMPVMNGIEASDKAMKEYPGLKIIALTMFNDDEYIQSMIDAGVKGFLIKNIKKDILDRALQEVNNGGNYYSQELMQFFTRRLTKEDDKSKEEELNITKREKEILQLMAEGMNNKEIADSLFVSERTIIGHKSNLLAKTGCKNTIGLLAYAIKNKLVEI